jgi:preprotein translocase subunit SecG
MANVLIVVYLLIVLALIGVILIQRSEGGALGIGGGSGGGLMTARGSANLLTRTTAILAVLFFATAIGLTVLSELDRGTSSILDRATTTQDGTAPGNVLDALNALQGDTASDLPVPADAQAPATTPAPAASAPAAAPTSDLPVPAAPATPDAPSDTTAAPEPAATDTQTPATTTGN